MHARAPTRSADAAVPVRGLVLQRKCACGGQAGASGECEACSARTGLQASLALGASNDPLEHQADRMAEQVLAGGAPEAASAAGASLQRAATAGSAAAEDVPASVHATLASPGRALEPALRHDMESRFGHDFARVRVHADTQADRSARDLGANAFAAGSHVVFAAGQYAPQSADGRRLIAHELAHVVQQSAAPAHSTVVQRDDKGKASAPPKEVEPVAPNQKQAEMIDKARRAAAVRTQVALFKASGVQGSGGFLEAKRLAQIKFDWPDPNMEQIAEILSGMGGSLITVDVKVAGKGDPECGSRAGYVRGHRPPIVLCPGFFKDPSDDEGRIRTMVHEMAHVKGIGSADTAEQYFPIFDCDQKGSFESADAWSNYVHCLSGQTPDKEEIQGNVGGVKKSAPKKTEGKK
jgi:Domain of unknown function (DUF4157)